MSAALVVAMPMRGPANDCPQRPRAGLSLSDEEKAGSPILNVHAGLVVQRLHERGIDIDGGAAEVAEGAAGGGLRGRG